MREKNKTSGTFGSIEGLDGGIITLFSVILIW